MQPFFADYYQLLETLLNDMEATISGVPTEGINWVPGPEMNSLGVLIYHTLGATRYLIGDVCLGESSNRDRAAEFAQTSLTASELHDRMNAVKAYLTGALGRLTMDDLPLVKPYPGRNTENTVSATLLHALDHVGLHLGHAQITRQLWDQRNS